MIIRLGRARISGCSSKAEQILVRHSLEPSSKLLEVNLVARELIHRSPFQVAVQPRHAYRHIIPVVNPAWSLAMKHLQEMIGEEIVASVPMMHAVQLQV
jgi:hypothetical protein